MDNSSEFVSYKKLIIFGAEGSGKTSLTISFGTGSFKNESHSDNGK